MYQDSQVELLQVDPSGADLWRLDAIVELIKNGGVGVIPTDTVYVDGSSHPWLQMGAIVGHLHIVFFSVHQWCKPLCRV